MRSKLFFAVGVFFCFSVFAAAAFGGGFAVTGVGPRAAGLCGAFRAIADDWSAAYWNPAGLAFQTKSQVTAGTSIISSRVKYTPKATINGYGLGFPSDSSEERFPFDRNIPLAIASGFLRFPQLGRLNLGVALYVPYHNHSQWDLFSLPYAFKGDTVPPFTFPEKNFESRLRVADVHPTAAISLMDGKLALGAGVSIDRADWNFSRPILTPVEQSYEPLVGEVDTLEKIFNNHPELKSRPEENVVSIVRVGAGSWGVGGNAGILYKPNEKVSVGLAYHSPVRFKLKGEYEQKIYFPDNDAKRLARDQIRDFFPDQYKFIFDGQGKDIFIGGNGAQLTLNLPQDFGGGIAYKINTQWTLATDLAWFNWKKMDSVVISFDNSSAAANLGTPTYRFGWKNTVKFSGGILFNPKPSWLFRAGYFFDQSPIPDSTFNPWFLDVGNKHSFSAGFSYLAGHWELAYNVELLAAQKRDFSSVTGLFENLPGVYRDTRFTTTASFTYRFDINAK